MFRPPSQGPYWERRECEEPAEVFCMACCSGYYAAEVHFDRKVAERDLRRYRRRGADATTRLLLTMVEASPSYLKIARREVGSRYGLRPTDFILGDFAAIAGTLHDADVVTLDRVVCCYPDVEALLRGAGALTVGVHLSLRSLVCAGPNCAGKLLAAVDRQRVSSLCSPAGAHGGLP